MNPNPDPDNTHVWHGGQLMPRNRLVMCSRCPFAKYAVIVRDANNRPDVYFYCPHCDRGAGQP